MGGFYGFDRIKFEGAVLRGGREGLGEEDFFDLLGIICSIYDGRYFDAPKKPHWEADHVGEGGCLQLQTFALLIWHQIDVDNMIMDSELCMSKDNINVHILFFLNPESTRKENR